MEFRIADTFTDSLARLRGDEQKAVKTTAFDLQLNPAAPGLSFHKLDRAKDKNFWSVRVDADIRIIVHRSDTSILLCYTDHHDPAYAWATRRKLETHPTTGAAQLVEIRETVQEIVVPVYVQAGPPPVFVNVTEERLLAFGVPPEWLADVKNATEEGLLALIDHLPAEAAEALLELATGGKPRPPTPPAPSGNAFDHPDAMRRFRAMTDVEELRRALDYPWDKWTVFLHPEQRKMVTKEWSGPVRVSGSAGTGKTIVALHRATHLARIHEDSRVLLATFSDPLANALQTKLNRLIGSEPRLGERIDVRSLDGVGLRLYVSRYGKVTVADRAVVRELLNANRQKFTLQFLLSEWDDIVDAWQLTTWEDYRDAPRLGRKTRHAEAKRQMLWSIFEGVRAGLKARGLVTMSQVFTALAALGQQPYDYAVVDEAQDISVSQLRFLAALGAGRSDALFFAGDLGQRIFRQPFSWKAAGVDIRGRAKTLKVNYRTSHQIRAQADRLLSSVVSDFDGNQEDRSATVSVFNSAMPTVLTLTSETVEKDSVIAWLNERSAEGVQPGEIGVFVRSLDQFQRAQEAVRTANLPFVTLDDDVFMRSGCVSIASMHLAKGLEFRAVVVMACDDDVIPLQERIETVGDDSDLEEVYNTERHLLYVACTRARDFLLVTGVRPASEFLADLVGGCQI